MSKRPRRSVPSRRSDLLITAAILAVVLVAAWVSLSARSGLPGVRSYRVTASFRDLANLKDHDDVRIAGVRVGQVLHVRSRGDRGVVDLALDDGLRLSADTQAVVRSRGVLGARYLELRPGTEAATLPDGGAIAIDHTRAGRDLTDVLATFDPATRRHVQDLVGGAGRGVSARGVDLNELLATLPSLTQDAGQAAGAVNARTGAAARLVPSLAATMSAIDPEADALARTVGDQAGAARPFAEARDDVGRTLRAAPAALHGIRGSLAASSPLLAAAQGLATTTRRSLAHAPAGLTATATMLRDARRPLTRATALIDDARRAVVPTNAALTALPPALTMLDSTFAAGTPLLRKLAAIRCDVHTFATGWQSMLGIAVKNRDHDQQLGPLTSLRLTVTPTPDTLNPLITGLTKNKLIGENPYPAPCEAGTEKLG